MSVQSTVSPALAPNETGASSQPMVNERFRKLLPILLLVIVGSFFGATTVNGKFAVTLGWNSSLFLAISATISGLLMVAFFALIGVWKNTSRAIWQYTIFSGLLFALPNLAMFFAVEKVGAGFVALVTAFASVLTYLIALLLREESFGIRRGLGVLLALVGTVTLSVDKLGGGNLQPIWVLLALSGPLFLAIGNVYRSKFWPEGASPFVLAPLMLLIAGLFSFLAAGLDLALAPTQIKMPLLPLLIQVAIFSLGFSFYFVLQKIAGAVYLSQIGPIIAFVGTVLSVLLLGEELSSAIAIGGFAIIAGVLIFNWAQQRRNNSA